MYRVVSSEPVVISRCTRVFCGVLFFLPVPWSFKVVSHRVFAIGSNRLSAFARSRTYLVSGSACANAWWRRRLSTQPNVLPPDVYISDIYFKVYPKYDIAQTFALPHKRYY